VATHRVEILTMASAEAAWDVVRDVGALHTRLVPGVVVDTKLEPGARIVTFASGMTVREPIVAIDEARRRLVWSASGGETTHYNASAEVVSDAGRTRVVWTADFLPDEASAAIYSLMARGAEVMRETLDRLSPAGTAPAGGVDAPFAREGKLSYLQIPASDVEATARFDAEAFGWKLSGGAGHRSFTDASGELLGAFMPGREISRQAGFLPYVYVGDVDAAVARIEAAGGEIERRPIARAACASRRSAILAEIWWGSGARAEVDPCHSRGDARGR
jgi:predicted enzyme related to lactoylglutathione lyase/carbon monoxide dehydrogenase subunit G